MKGNPHGARSTCCHAASWCRTFREPPRLERGKPDSDGYFRKRVVLPPVQKTLQSIPTRITPRKKLKVLPPLETLVPSATNSFVNIPKSGLERAFAFAQTVMPSKPLGVLVDEMLKNVSFRDINVEADDTSSDSDVERDSKQLHVMIDHLMVRGPKAEQTPLGLRSVPRQGQDRVTRQQSKSSFCPGSDRGGHHLHTDADLVLWFFMRTGCAHHHGAMLPPSWIAGRLSATWVGGKFHEITELWAGGKIVTLARSRKAHPLCVGGSCHQTRSEGTAFDEHLCSPGPQHVPTDARADGSQETRCCAVRIAIDGLLEPCDRG